jgi:hypothetical protein
VTIFDAATLASPQGNVLSVVVLSVFVVAHPEGALRSIRHNAWLGRDYHRTQQPHGRCG